MIRKILHWAYRAVRPIIFCFDSEKVHGIALGIGEWMGKYKITRTILETMIPFSAPSLSQTVAGIHFLNPVGLAAGFDYEARLTQILKSTGFGFGTVGTITNLPYEGNEKPRLGRLVASRTLVVNKGFKNLGIDKTLEKLSSSVFSTRVGISIGKTNTLEHTTQQQGIDDILNAFTKTEASKVPFSYYELNISCPNLHGSIEFYSSVHLQELLTALFRLKLSHPVFIKMPIIKTDEETVRMLETIAHFPVAGIIIGNLYGDRTLPLLDQEKLKAFPKGGLSGMATQARSDELIALAYKNFGKKFIIIGCGGVFSAEDAYRKIKLGATLVQLITGMVFEGPQFPASVNEGLAKLIKKDGFKSISDAVGIDVQ